MIAPPSIEHQVKSQLLKTGFTPASIDHYWPRVDRSGTADDILDRIMEQALIDQSIDGGGPASNNEEPAYESSADGDAATGQDAVAGQVASPPPRGSFDIPEDDAEGTEGGSAFTSRVLSAAEIEALANTPDPEDARLVPFPPDAVRGVLAEAVQEWMRHLQMPALLPVSCALSAVSVALGRGVYALSNKARTYPNIFSVLGAQSGSGKTLVYNAAVAPLEEVQITLTDEAEEQSHLLRAKLALLKKDIEVTVADYKKLKGKDTELKAKGKELSGSERAALEDKLKELHQQQADMEDMLAYSPAVWTSDFTSEALGVRLHNGNEVLAVLSDEGGIVLYDLQGRYSDGNYSDDMLLCKCFSVNSHAVDRIGRGRIVLHNPCVALLLLVQPDILRKAFEDERLLIGGFLARCLAADTRLKMLPETDESAARFHEAITLKWAELLRELYHAFHDLEKPCRIEVEPEVRSASRLMHNDIVWRVAHQLSDVSSFACRWVEQAWKVALILHMAEHGVSGKEKPLTVDTFNRARAIVRYFATQQLDVLAVTRRAGTIKTHNRLQELFIANKYEPMSLRSLRCHHNLQREPVLLCVKEYPHHYRVEERRNLQGGGTSTVVVPFEAPPQ
jgi:hypothetical protein